MKIILKRIQFDKLIMRQKRLFLCGTLIRYVIILFVIGMYAWAHIQAGNTLPIPWDDEAAFLWQAIGFLEGSALKTRYLNDERPVLWMPPGYMFVQALAFKLFGVSLPLARAISMIFMLIAFSVTLFYIWEKPLRILSILIVIATWLGPCFVAIGNIARMDALCFATGLVATVAILRGSVYKGLSLQILNLLIHPNSLFFLSSNVISLALLIRSYDLRLKRGDLTFITLAGALLSIYLIYVILNFEYFRNDMRYQLLRKADRFPIVRLIESGDYVYFIVLLVILLICAFKKLTDIFMVSFAMSCMCIYKIGLEMWYEVYGIYAFVMVGLYLIWGIWVLMKQSAMSFYFRICVIMSIYTVFLYWLYLHGFVTGPRNWPKKITWGWGMRTESDIKYFTPSDRSNIIEIVESMVEKSQKVDQRPARVRFLPGGEGLFFHSAWSNVAYVYYPIFTTTRCDILIVRESRYYPGWINDSMKKHIEMRSSNNVLIRDSTEKWWFISLYDE